MAAPRKHTKPDRDWFTHLPDAALIRAAQIASTDASTCPLINVGSATWHRWVQTGYAPQPVRVSRAFTAWRCGDLRAWLAGMTSTDKGMAAHAAHARSRARARSTGAQAQAGQVAA